MPEPLPPTDDAPHAGWVPKQGARPVNETAFDFPEPLRASAEEVKRRAELYRARQAEPLQKRPETTGQTFPERAADYGRDTQRRAELYQERQVERLQKRLEARKNIKGRAGKAIAGKAVSMVAKGIIKQSHFFYLAAFVLALVGDILDFFTLSLPLFDFILGLLLLTLVYPYINDPTVRLITYFISLFDFIPFVGFLPFWAIATVYAWRAWAKEERAARQETYAPAQRQELAEPA